MAEVVLNKVSKVYGEATQPAVNNLDLEVRDGEFMVLVGPSGCGKTTALRMVAGLEDISSGEIRIGGRAVNRVPSKDRDIAMVFQNYALYPHLTVRENMGFGLKLRKTKKSEINRRVKEAAKVLGLEDFLDRKPRQLSGGQRQRVAMGRAIVRDPAVFLMDEPLSNLDAKLRVQMRSEIARIQKNLEVTTIYVTHDQVEAMTMGDRVAVMKKGLLQQVDSPQALYDHPVNIFVGGFIGSPSMNMVEARLAADESNGSGLLTASFGHHVLPLGTDVLAKRPSLESYLGRSVVLGIRPEDMEDASVVGDSVDPRSIEVTVDLVEQMGSEAYLHFEVDAPPVLTEDTRELAKDVGRDLADVERSATGRGANLTARVSPRTKAKPGEPLRLVVDTERLHFFDIDSGQAIWNDRS